MILCSVSDMMCQIHLEVNIFVPTVGPFKNQLNLGQL